MERLTLTEITLTLDLSLGGVMVARNYLQGVDGSRRDGVKLIASTVRSPPTHFSVIARHIAASRRAGGDAVSANGTAWAGRV